MNVQNKESRQATPYVPVSVAAAREIGRSFGKSIVVICAWDAAHGVLHTTTWGDAPLDKHHAAIAGELCATALKADVDDRTVFTDYRLLAIRQLTAALEAMAAMHGGTHADDCPEDDTCRCRHKPFNDQVNAAINRGRELLGITDSAPTEPLPAEGA